MAQSESSSAAPDYDFRCPRKVAWTWLQVLFCGWSSFRSLQRWQREAGIKIQVYPAFPLSWKEECCLSLLRLCLHPTMIRSECLCPLLPILICWNPNAQCDGLRRWGLWEVILSTATLVNETNAVIIGEVWESSLIPFTVGGHRRSQQSASRERAFTRMWPQCHSGPGLSASWTEGKKFLLLMRLPVCDILLQQPK